MKKILLTLFFSIILSTVLVGALSFMQREQALIYDGNQTPGGNFVCSTWRHPYTCNFGEFIENEISFFPFLLPIIGIGTALLYPFIYLVIRKKIKN